MSSYPTLTPRVIGQAEKTLNAILDRLLADSGLTEHQWIILTLAATGETAEYQRFVRQVAHMVKIGETDARARIGELTEARLLQAPGDGTAVTATESGLQLHTRIRAAVTEITQRLWSDLPAEDLATAGRVLSIITERANAELANAFLPHRVA
jgi:DNA-binding MarR family transcriptional regulator